ncbi:hypothetical protein [Paenibacillus sp. PDC88]|uniref:hypothetical protein n=1 Tax=Paenibacillus sp. PDC88 TaxID=1884375 RepID=UPI0008942E45|nr:hypothetical protein [Paenibacillus sp. PDC88]SDW31124.1 hypothetical protein SAMN05518848_101965 [Paenibacillus sp. PDC88]
MNKNLQHNLNQIGQGFQIKRIDQEDCLYKDLGEYDIEISGGHRKNGPFHLYVWRKKGLRIVYRKLDVRSISRLKFELNLVMELHEGSKQGIKWPEEE